MARSSLRTLSLFLIVVIGAGIAIGFAAAPGPWYGALKKPWYNPPAWIFAPVWTLLYVLIAIAGWRVWSRAPKSAAMLCWAVQMGLNWLWSPLFFGIHQPWLALAVILALLIAILSFIVLARRVDGVAPALFVPYAAWVAFATLLNASLAVMN